MRANAWDMPDTASSEAVYALLIDGTPVRIRALGTDDLDAVRDLHRGMSPDNLYLRFFGHGERTADEVAAHLCRDSGPEGAALGLWLAGDLVGVAEYDPAGEEGVAEIALAVADDMHGRGVGTLLLEHLVSLARERGVREFRAQTLMQNVTMLRVFSSAGLPVRRRVAGGIVEVTMPLATDAPYLDAVAERERRADVESLAHVLRPASIAVVGAGRRADSVGGAVLRRLVSSPFRGTVWAVNPRAGALLAGVPCFRSVTDLPEAPDLAVVAVPPDAVVPVAEDCGRRGARALVVITSGVEGAGLLAVCHKYGMRLVGPNCFGVADTAAGLDATFAARPVRPGVAGIVVQSGGIGIALRDRLSRLGIGVSSFVSVGDKYDVSSNDLLMWWESDATTHLGVLHVESFGNPRKFARTARRVARRMPLLTVVAGRSAAGQRAAASHTAAAATPAVTQEALFQQAGIIVTRGLGELVGAAALLAHQPVPAGPRVAIVSNVGGAGVLTADACADAGLTAAALSEPTVRALARLLPHGAACAGPVDTTAAISPGVFARCLDVVAADDAVDAVIAVVVPTAVSDPAERLGAGGAAKPMAAVLLDQPEPVAVRSGPGDRHVPSYAFPEDAARAMARACAYGRWLRRPLGRAPSRAGRGGAGDRRFPRRSPRRRLAVTAGDDGAARRVRPAAGALALGPHGRGGRRGGCRAGRRGRAQGGRARPDTQERRRGGTARPARRGRRPQRLWRVRGALRRPARRARAGDGRRGRRGAVRHRPGTGVRPAGRLRARRRRDGGPGRPVRPAHPADRRGRR